jgi:hypothetical protein
LEAATGSNGCLMVPSKNVRRTRSAAGRDGFSDLFGAAELPLARITPTASPNSIIEGVRA